MYPHKRCLSRCCLESSRVVPSRTTERLDPTVCILLINRCLSYCRPQSSRVAPSRSIEQLDPTVGMQSDLVVCLVCSCTCAKGACHTVSRVAPSRPESLDLVVCVMCNCTCAKGACHTVAPSRPESPRVARPCGLCDVMGEKAAGPRAHRARLQKQRDAYPPRTP